MKSSAKAKVGSGVAWIGSQKQQMRDATERDERGSPLAAYTLTGGAPNGLVLRVTFYYNEVPVIN